MSITSPALTKIAFSKNLLQVILQSDDYLAAVAAKSVNFWEFDSAIAADTEVVISWPLGAATLTAKDAPDDSGLQFPTGDGGNAYVTSILDWLNGNPFISGAYKLATDLTGAHPRIIFTAINNGPDYDFDIENEGATGNTTPGVTDEPRSNFMHHLELWISTSDGSFTQAFSANIPLDYPLTGKTTLNIGPELDSFLFKQSDKPDLLALSAICPNSIRAFYYRYAEFYGDTPFVRKLTTSPTAFIAKGGLSKQNALLRNLVTELTPGADKTKWRFLRQGSINKLVSIDQPEWLYWINIADAAKTVNLQVKIFNQDASNFTFTSVAALAVGSYQKIQFQVGFTQLNIAARQDEKIPIYYQVQLINNADGTALTAAYGYVIDYQYREWPRYFIYENSYGAFQTIGTIGKGLNEADRVKDDAQYQVNENQAAIDGEFLEINIRLQEKGTVNVGYDRSDKRNTALLRDFLASQAIFIWQNGTLVPIGLNTTNLKDAADGVNKYASSFEYYPLYQEEVYTEPSGLTDSSINDLLAEVGSPVIGGAGTPVGGSGDVIIVNFGNPNLSIDGDDHQKYTSSRLVGLENYAVWSTQLDQYLIGDNITYDKSDGTFIINVDGFALIAGEQLIISPYVLNTDE